jgi:hypothetical protein
LLVLFYINFYFSALKFKEIEEKAKNPLLHVSDKNIEIYRKIEEIKPIVIRLFDTNKTISL